MLKEAHDFMNDSEMMVKLSNTAPDMIYLNLKYV